MNFSQKQWEKNEINYKQVKFQRQVKPISILNDGWEVGKKENESYKKRVFPFMSPEREAQSYQNKDFKKVIEI